MNTVSVFWLLTDLARDVFFIGGSVWLVVHYHWSGWTIVGGIGVAMLTSASIKSALKSEDSEEKEG